MPPIKKLARKSDFLASIISKTFFLFSKLEGSPFARFLNIKKPLFS